MSIFQASLYGSRPPALPRQPSDLEPARRALRELMGLAQGSLGRHLLIFEGGEVVTHIEGVRGRPIPLRRHVSEILRRHGTDFDGIVAFAAHVLGAEALLARDDEFPGDHDLSVLGEEVEGIPARWHYLPHGLDDEGRRHRVLGLFWTDRVAATQPIEAEPQAAVLALAA